MSNRFSALISLAALPFALIAAEPPTTGSESGPNGAGPPGYQTWPGHQATDSEQAPRKHVLAAAAHDQAAAHHRAAAMALQGGKPDQAKQHADAAEKSADEAGLKSKAALTPEPGK